MWDEHGEPSEALIEHWNVHNDHAEDADVDCAEADLTEDDCAQDGQDHGDQDEDDGYPFAEYIGA